MDFIMRVEGFPAQGSIPVKYTCTGSNHSPALTWSDPPQGTKSFALIMDDPDAPGGVWNHWLLWNIPPTISGLGENAHLPSPARSGTNDFGRTGYGGPCPPKGHGPHRYFFRLFALNVETIGLSAAARRAELDRIMAPHILARAEYMGRFERK
jgi:Raf kinase inhibitor-like YbhB/YbcL family protein